MNYLFQLRGLFNDDLLNPGAPHLDLSGQRLGGLDENNLRDIGQLGFDLDAPNGVPLYHSGWYSPRESVRRLRNTATVRSCCVTPTESHGARDVPR